MSRPVADQRSARSAGVTTVADLTEEHHGWSVRIPDKTWSVPVYRTFTIGKGFGCGIRRWTYEGVEYVGITDDVRSPGIVGTERTYPADTPCVLVRQVKKYRPRKAASATDSSAGLPKEAPDVG